MNFIKTYVTGEKIQCIIGIIIAVISIAFSIWFLLSGKPVLKGTAYAMLPLSALLLIICVGVVARTSKDIERVNTFYEKNPQKIHTEELPRMEKVLRTFNIIKKIELVFLCVGLLLVFIFWKHELVRGIAFGLILQGAILFVFDHVAEARGKIYTESLKKTK